MLRQANAFASADCRRRLAQIPAKRQTIDAARLAELAGNPALKSDAIARQFGYGRATFFMYLNQHEELWDVYEQARLRAGKKVAKANLRTKRGPLSDDDLKIIDAVTHGARTVAAIEAASEVNPRIFASLLYNLENERHELYSHTTGQPPVTRFFTRAEEEARKGKAA